MLIENADLIIGIIPALIGAAAAIGGGLLSSSSANKQAKQQAALQKQFAQNAIQWKVEDAKKAGIHPLYALGANTVSYSPVSVGGTDYGLASAGQDISRAYAAGMSEEGKTTALTDAIGKTQLEGAQLDNELKRTEIASKLATLNQAGSPPPGMAMGARWLLDGQIPAPESSSPEIANKTTRDVSEPGSPHTMAGAGPDLGLALAADGSYQPHQPPQLAEAYESDWLGNLMWQYRNRVIPNLELLKVVQGGATPDIARKPYERVVWDPYSQGWRVVRGKLSFRR